MAPSPILGDAGQYSLLRLLLSNAVATHTLKQ
jgi:hypothetical protein